MAGASLMRSDISCTVFLSDVDEYEGGELVMEGYDSQKTYKLPKGSAIIYPSHALHSVNAVTKGERRVCVTWIQSLVRSGEKREILFDIDVARKEIFSQSGKNKTFDSLSKSYMNLLRMWGEV